MAKKNVKYYIPGGIALVLGIAAFCMMFLQAISYGEIGGESIGYTGAQLAFGYSESFLGSKLVIWEFNIMIFLAFFLPLIGGIIACVTKNNFIIKIITTALFVVGAVFLFTTNAYTEIGQGNGLGTIIGKAESSLAVGPIIAGILSIIGAVVCFFKGSIAKMIK